MAYELDLGSPLPHAIRAVAREELEYAVAQLAETDPATLDRRIHETRKSLKKLRALLRLARGELGQEVYGSENRSLRDVARLLAASRDAAAALATFRKLRERSDTPEPFESIEQALTQARDQAAGSEAHTEAAESALRELRAALARLGRWPLRHEQWSAIGNAFERAYRDGRRGLKHAERRPHPEEFHEWRKAVKTHWYHVRLLNGAWPDLLGSYAAQLDELAELLGDDHDLAMLSERLTNSAGAWGERENVSLAERAIAERVGELRARARELGHRIYAERPAAIAARFGRYFELTRAERQRDEDND